MIKNNVIGNNPSVIPPVDIQKGYAAGAPTMGYPSIPPVTKQFDTGATRDTDSNKLDYEGFISPLVEKRFAEYMHECRLRNIPEGQSIRSSDNWQKGIPLDSYAKSLVRHVQEFRLIHDGFEAIDEKGNVMSLENVLCAIRFNVDGYLFELLKGKNGQRPMPGMPDSQSQHEKE
jgi:hypothetical protein